MGIESLFNTSSENFRADIIRTHNQERGSRPVTHIVWDRFLLEAKDDLTVLSKKVAPAQGLVNDEARAMQIRTEGRGAVTVISLMAAFYSIEDAIVAREYQYGAYLDRINSYLSGTLYPQFFADPKVPFIEPIDDTRSNRPAEQSRWQRMIALIKKDKSFSEFFKPENRHLLPLGIVSHLEKNQFFPASDRFFEFYKAHFNAAVRG